MASEVTMEDTMARVLGPQFTAFELHLLPWRNQHWTPLTPHRATTLVKALGLQLPRPAHEVLLAKLPKRWGVHPQLWIANRASDMRAQNLAALLGCDGFNGGTRYVLKVL
jgi:hypothetical protein